MYKRAGLVVRGRDGRAAAAGGPRGGGRIVRGAGAGGSRGQAPHAGRAAAPAHRRSPPSHAAQHPGNEEITL